MGQEEGTGTCIRRGRSRYTEENTDSGISASMEGTETPRHRLMNSEKRILLWDILKYGYLAFMTASLDPVRFQSQVTTGNGAGLAPPWSFHCSLFRAGLNI